MSSLWAKATIIVLRTAGLRPLLAAFLVHKPAPGQLDHAVAHSGIPRSRQSFFSTLDPAFVWCAGQASVARHCPLISQLAREHFLDGISAVSTPMPMI
jgi:hypothetical protein